MLIVPESRFIPVNMDRCQDLMGGLLEHVTPALPGVNYCVVFETDAYEADACEMCIFCTCLKRIVYSHLYNMNETTLNMKRHFQW